MTGNPDSGLEQFCKGAQERLTELVQQAHNSRKQIVDFGSPGIAGPEELLTIVRTCRFVVDVLEASLVECMYIKMRCEQYRSLCSGAVEDAEVETAGRAADYATSRDRNIEVNTRTLVERRRLRTAERWFIEARECSRMVEAMHRGADGHRQDAATRLRALTLTTQLER